MNAKILVFVICVETILYLLLYNLLDLPLKKSSATRLLFSIKVILIDKFWKSKLKLKPIFGLDVTCCKFQHSCKRTNLLITFKWRQERCLSVRDLPFITSYRFSGSDLKVTLRLHKATSGQYFSLSCYSSILIGDMEPSASQGWPTAYPTGL